MTFGLSLFHYLKVLSRFIAGQMKKLLFLFIISLLFNSCAIFYHYNDFGEVPKKPGQYPVFTSKDYLIGSLDEYRAGYDVSFYDLNLNLDPGNKRIQGNVLIYFKALKKLDKIRFDLYRNLKIDSVCLAGQRMQYKRSDRAVIVSLPDTLIPEEVYTLGVYYDGKPQKAKDPPWKGGLVWKKDKQGNPWIGVSCETEGGSIWFPCKDHLSDEPDSVRLTISVPKSLQVVSNGLLKEHLSTIESEKYTWETHYPINIYNITFYAGQFEHISDTLNTKDGILSLDYYVLPEHIDTARQHFKQVKNIINFYSNSFGPYPWIKDGFKLVEAPFEGMEHQTAIAYGSGFRNDIGLGGDYIIIHETAHEWWGNAVSVSDFSDIWLQEGFATYSEMLYAEHMLGYNRSLIYADYMLAGFINNKLPVVGPTGVSYWDYKDTDVYLKGAMILHTIRNVVNDSTLFFDILKTFYSEHAAKTHASTADFIEVVERKTGRDWSKFFEAYLNSREVPVLEYLYNTYEDDQNSAGDVKNSSSFFLAKWTHVPEGFTMPVTLACKESSSSVTIEVSTKPKVFYLSDLGSCSELSYNKRLSYFVAKENKALLMEIE